MQWITGYRAAEVILRHKGCREVTFKGLVPLLGNVIVTLEGQPHRQRRTLEGRLFWPALLRQSENDWVARAIDQTLSNLGREACLVEISYRVMARIAGHLTGLDGLDDEQRAALAVHLLGALVGGTRSHSHGRPALTRRQARDELRRQIVDRSIMRRQNLVRQYQAGRIGRDALPSDLITLLLLHPPGDGPSEAAPVWSTRQIAAEVLFYAVAAIDTTANLLAHLLHELWKFTAKYPQHQPLLCDLDFLRQAAAEALRLHPAIPTIFRQAIAQVILEDGTKFEAGETAGLYITQANRDPAIFGPDANEFNPFRPLPDKVRRAGLSFGGGAHLCLGREMALGAPDRDGTELRGAAVLLAHALLQKGPRPHPEKPVAEPSPFERDVFKEYPVLLL